MAFFFEDYEAAGVGRSWRSAERTVALEDIAAFAALTGDTHPQHLDPAYGAASPYGAVIAHGFLTISLASGLVYQLGLDAGAAHAILGTSWRLNRAVFAGDRLRVEVTVTALRASRSQPGLGIVERRYDVFKQDGALAATGEIALLVKRRPAL
jgi:acyl dehydratase